MELPFSPVEGEYNLYNKTLWGVVLITTPCATYWLAMTPSHRGSDLSVSVYTVAESVVGCHVFFSLWADGVNMTYPTHTLN